MAGDVFEQVRTGAMSAEEGALLLEKQRQEANRPTKPAWLPKPLYAIGILLLTLLIPKLVGRA